MTLLDRPYRRLVESLPVRYVGFTVPDELFVGYGFDDQERYRNLARPARSAEFDRFNLGGRPGEERDRNLPGSHVLRSKS